MYFPPCVCIWLRVLCKQQHFLFFVYFHHFYYSTHTGNQFSVFRMRNDMSPPSSIDSFRKTKRKQMTSKVNTQQLLIDYNKWWLKDWIKLPFRFSFTLFFIRIFYLLDPEHGTIKGATSELNQFYDDFFFFFSISGSKSIQNMQTSIRSTIKNKRKVHEKRVRHEKNTHFFRLNHHNSRRTSNQKVKQRL